MNYDCGLTGKSTRSMDWIKSVDRLCNLPDDVRHELRVLMLTPGINIFLLSKVFGRAEVTFRRELRSFNHEEYQQEAADNYNSITREDALAIAQLRPSQTTIPIFCRVYMAEDQTHMKQQDVARLWKVTNVTLWFIRRYGPLNSQRGTLPDWFRDQMLIGA